MLRIFVARMIYSQIVLCPCTSLFVSFHLFNKTFEVPQGELVLLKQKCKWEVGHNFSIYLYPLVKSPFSFNYLFIIKKTFFLRWGPFLKFLLNLLQYCFCFMFWFFGRETCEILAPWPGIKPSPPALEGEVLTTGPPGKSPLFLKKCWMSNFFSSLLLKLLTYNLG